MVVHVSVYIICLENKHLAFAYIKTSICLYNDKFSCNYINLNFNYRTAQRKWLNRVQRGKNSTLRSVDTFPMICVWVSDNYTVK